MAALVFCLAVATAALGHLTGHITGIWVANAVWLAFLLKHRTRHWVVLIAAGFAGNLASDLFAGYAILPTVYMCACNAIEVLIVAAPMRTFELDREFARPKSLLTFYALAIGPAPVISALLVSTAFHATYGTDFVTSSMNWYAADALGLSIVVPPLMTVHAQALKAMFRREQIFETLLLVGVVLGAVVINVVARDYPLAFLFFPAVVLLTFQRGFAGGAIGLLLTASYLLEPVLFGHTVGAIKLYPTREKIIIVQIFIAVTGFSVMLVGAALEQRRRAEKSLATAMARMESSHEEALVAKDAAERANRTKSMFLATMSHELRTPLNAVIGFAEVMHAEMFGPLGHGRYREYTDMIQGAGRHLLELINDVLDMSKIEAGKHELNRERIAVGQVIQECVDLMTERAAQGDVSLVADLPATLLWANADRRALKQIVLNLLSNAIKFTPPGGIVVTRARIQDSILKFSVIDTGVGIPTEQLCRLGNPFVQLRTHAGTSHTGTGLGLALVRALAQLHGGSLKIESVEGRGTTVSVEIPAAEAAVLAA